MKKSTEQNNSQPNKTTSTPSAEHKTPVESSDSTFRRVPEGLMILLARLSVSMGVTVFLSNILAAKIWGFQLPILGWTFTFDAGLLLFPLSFLLGDMIIEIFGKRLANQVSWMTAIANIVAFGTLYLADLLPSIGIENGIDFQVIFGESLWVVIGSSVSFLLSRLLNNELFARYRASGRGIFKWRALRSSFWGRLADTLIFNFIAFRGRLGDWELIRHMLCAFTIGMLLEWLLCELATSRMVRAIKHQYQLEEDAHISVGD